MRLAKAGWGLGVAWALTSVAALPCSPELGRPSLRVPKLSVVPANLLRFRLAEQLGVESFQMRDASSRRLVPLTIRDGVLIALAEPQRPSEVELTYPLLAPLRALKQHTVKFTVGLPEPLELRKAGLTVVEYGVKYPGSERNEAGFVRVQFDSPDAKGNAGHLLEHEVTVDGHKHQFEGNDQIVELDSRCHAYEGVIDEWGVDTCGNLTNVPRGWHTITVTSHVLGEDKQPDPVSLRVQVQCLKHGSPLRP